RRIGYHRQWRGCGDDPCPAGDGVNGVTTLRVGSAFCGPSFMATGSIGGALSVRAGEDVAHESSGWVGTKPRACTHPAALPSTHVPPFLADSRLSPCRPVALSPCRPVALSPCRPFTRSPVHPYSSMLTD